MLRAIAVLLICAQVSSGDLSTKWASLPGVKASESPSWATVRTYLRQIARGDASKPKRTETFMVGRVIELDGVKIQLVYWVNRRKILTIDHPVHLNPELLPYQMSKRCLDIDSGTLPRETDPRGSTYLSTWTNTQEMLRECQSNGVRFVVTLEK